MPKTLILIPSRMSAVRLPGKPLLKINNLSIISHVVNKAKKTKIGRVVVCAEDKSIFDDVVKNGGEAILTGNHHKSGTDRIFEGYKKLGIKDVDYILRDGKVVHEGSIVSIFREKNAVKEVKNGLECGIAFKNFADFKEKDIIESYSVDLIQREIHD